MRNYRAYEIGPDGRFAQVHELNSQDDESAKLLARQLSATAQVELWQGARLIGRLDKTPA